MLLPSRQPSISPGRAALEAVIGAASSGLAVVKAVRELGVAVSAFERGSYAGGLWRYDERSPPRGAADAPAAPAPGVAPAPESVPIPAYAASSARVRARLTRAQANCGG